MHISADDQRLRWRGAVSLEASGDSVTPWRLPHQDSDLYLPVGGIGCATMPSGVRIGFRTDAAEFDCHYMTFPPLYDSVPPEFPRVDARIDGALYQTVELERRTDDGAFRVGQLPAGDKLVELWLPIYSQFRFRGLDLPSGSCVARDDSGVPGWTHYGCSVSQGRGAASPSENWLAQVARRGGLDLTSLSMAGTCHLQPMFARLTRDLPATLISVHAGTNIYYYGSLSRDTLQAAVIGFVQIVREKHPVTPLVMISPTFGPNYERRPGPTKLTHKLIREEMKSACEWMTDRGDENLHYVNGLDLLGPDDEPLLLEPPDAQMRIHFSSAAHDLVARRLLSILQGCGAVTVPESPGAFSRC